jgi:hypothetical protein
MRRLSRSAAGDLTFLDTFDSCQTRTGATVGLLVRGDVSMARMLRRLSARCKINRVGQCARRGGDE